MCNTDKKISVIVPVYKTEPFLRICVDSIIHQTYTNLEIILVDDGSPDGCPEICDEYAKRDNRVRVIHKNNGGLSDSRNYGLAAATGEYIGFVDSDDWISETMYQELIDITVYYKADIVCCGYTRTTGDALLTEWCCGPERCVDAEQALRDILDGDGTNVVMWNKLYAAHLFENIYFPTGEIHEDNAVFFQVIGNAKRFAYLDNIHYYYRQRSDSIMGRGYTDKGAVATCRNLDKLKEYLDYHYPSLLMDFKKYEANVIGEMMLSYLYSGGTTRDEAFNTLKQRFKGKLQFFIGHQCVPLSHKTKMILIKMRLFDMVKKIYHSINK